MKQYTRRDGLPDNNIHDLLEDHEGRLWVGTRLGGFFRLEVSAGQVPRVAEVYSRQNGLPTDWIFQLYETADGRFWVATNKGLIPINRDQESRAGGRGSPHRTQCGDFGNREPLSSIAQISRESVASMGDIVWAINPKHDHLTDLIHRMRRLATEVFAGRKIEYEVEAPDPDTDLRLGADVRRDVLLIFKEAINNVVRHSDCSTVRIELWLEHSCLNLRIVDDGRGFDPDHPSEGNGLASMKQRASGLDGELKVTSIEAKGTEVTLRVPH